MSKPLELKDTINLPKTSFSMKANLPQNEPKWLDKWNREDLYGQIRAARKDAPIFTMHDGPPYANNRIHLGTALNKIMKDLIVKSKTIEGFNAPYLPGWDCHGLPIEINIDKELGPRKAKMSAVEIRQACRRYAEKYVDIQRTDFRRLGVLGEWDNPYLTMNFEYEALIAEAFLHFLEKGYVYRGLKPVLWCIHCQTALAEAEVEYEEHRSRSVYVRYALLGDPAALDPALAGRKVSVVIWTTTPWTLPASMAVAFHPDFEYVAVASKDGEVFLLESRRFEQLRQQQFKVILSGRSESVGYDLGAATAEGKELGQIIARIPGKKLERLQFQHPFLDRRVLGVLARYVTAEDGTGCVHTAPGHGREDYQTGTAYGIETYCPVGPAGEFVEGLPEYKGKKVFDANEAIITLLKARSALVGEPGFLLHSYPHCWRCHNPVIFRAANQWFISIDHNQLRQRTLEEIRKVKWLPEWGEPRIYNMIETRPDWCISRQRVWGVPITVFHCGDCEKPLIDPPEFGAALARKTIEVFRKEGSDAWYTHPVEDLIPAGTKCPSCGRSRFRKETDIIDVWFESGTSHYAVLGRRADLPWPSDVYLEAGDQYRGWFHSSLLVAMCTHGKAPYRSVLTHGWVLDAQGRAMSKSLGNVIEPMDIIKTHGAEVLRLWAASLVLGEDIGISEEMIVRLSEAYRKLRNTFRYCLGNLYDFDPRHDMVAGDALEEIDSWALDRTAAVLEKVGAAYREFAFHKVYRTLNDFATVDLSAFYFDILKDRLYTAPPRSPRRRAAQTVLFRIADALSRVISPLLCFTADEVWSHLRALPDGASREPSVHMAMLTPPAKLREGIPAQHLQGLENWPQLATVRGEVLKALEAARAAKQIGGSLEARVTLQVEGDLVTLLERYRPFLRYLFIVSQVELTESGLADGMESGLPGLQVKIDRASGEKCHRCWNYSEQVGQNARYPTVCERCADALREIESGLA